MKFDKIVNSKFYEFMKILSTITFLHVLWVLLVVLGLFVFTFYPATLAVHTSMSNLIYKKDQNIIKNFIKVFKSEYVKSQKIFIPILLIIGLLVFNFLFFFNQVSTNQSIFNYFGYYITIILLIYSVVFIATSFIIYPLKTGVVIEHYKLVVRYNLLFPFNSILMLTSLLLSIIMIYLFIAFTVFIGIPIMVGSNILITSKSINKYQTLLSK